MKLCPFCAEEIQDAAIKCKHCGEMLNEVSPVGSRKAKISDRPAKVAASIAPVSETLSVMVVCPKCSKQESRNLNFDQAAFSFTCGPCKAGFTSRVVRMRAKNSRKQARQNRRHFSLRVYLPNGAEDLIEFDNLGVDDFELRSKDIVLLSYIDKRLGVVQNLTLNRFMKVVNPSCYLATYVYGPQSDEVAALRAYRDTVLLPNPFLRSLVTVYYWISPKLIDLLGDSAFFRKVVSATLARIIQPRVRALASATPASRPRIKESGFGTPFLSALGHPHHQDREDKD